MEKVKGLSGNMLKMIAVISMFIDHSYKVGLLPYHIIFEIIGRIAFPVFAFLVAEGAYHTSNRKKYLVTLFLFALISEVPFNLCFYGTYSYVGHQNIMFTMFVGVAFAYIAEAFENKLKFPEWMAIMLLMMFAGVIGLFCNLDYSMYGTLLVFLLCSMNIFSQKNRLMSYKIIGSAFLVIFSIACFSTGAHVQIYGLIAIPLFILYNGRRSNGDNKVLYGKFKYFFYVFYPIHMAILFLIERM